MAVPIYSNDLTTIATGDLNFDAGTWDESSDGGWDTAGAMVDDENLWYTDNKVNTGEANSSCTSAQYTKNGSGSGTSGPGTIMYVHTAAFTVPTDGVVLAHHLWAAPPALNVYEGTPGSAEAGDIYFMTEGWRLIVDLTKTAISGALTSDNYPTAYFTSENVPVFPTQISSLVNSVTTTTNVVTGDLSTVATAQENADATWSDQRALDVVNEIKYIERAVHIDPEALTQGIGTQAEPFNTVEAGLDFAELHNYKLLHILSDAVADRNLKNFVVIGIGTPTIDCNGHNLDKSEFFHCRMRGNYSGEILVQQSLLLPDFQLRGIFEKCPILGRVEVVGDALIVGCYSNVVGSGYPILDILAGEVIFRDYHGSIGISGCNAGTQSIGVVSGGRILLDASCTGGLIHLRGLPFSIVDNSSAGCTVVDETDSELVRNIPNAVWDVPKDSLVNTSSIGYYISKKLLNLQKFIGLK